ncbi:MAG: hypothetical protein WDN24_14285 [Sphingomonas sp.]
MYDIAFDGSSGIISVRANAVLNAEEFARYARELRHHVLRARWRQGQVRILVDATAGGVLPGDVAQGIAELQRELLTGAHDRIAVIVSTSLQKLQVRRISLPGKGETFLSESAARTWLSAYAHMDSAA